MNLFGSPNRPSYYNLNIPLKGVINRITRVHEKNSKLTGNHGKILSN